MLFMTKKVKIFIALLCIGVILLCGTIYIKGRENIEVTDIQEPATVAAVAAATPIPTPAPESEIKEIVVYVCGGGVKTPQNVRLPEGARVEDAIKAAGGTVKEADLNQLNLAHILADQEKVFVPKKGEHVPAAEAGGDAAGSGGTPGTSIVNINTAGPEQLDSLPGVGPSTAQKIVDYREANGDFKSIEELKNVSGIGDKKFESLKDHITVR